MLLADKSPECAPEDVFKANRVINIGKKELPEKVTLANHWRNEDLQTEFSPIKNRKPKQKWSQFMDQFNGTERLLNGIVSKGEAAEKDLERRDRELAAYLSMPKRGTLRPSQ